MISQWGKVRKNEKRSKCAAFFNPLPIHLCVLPLLLFGQIHVSNCFSGTTYLTCSAISQAKLEGIVYCFVGHQANGGSSIFFEHIFEQHFQEKKDDYS